MEEITNNSTECTPHFNMQKQSELMYTVCAWSDLKDTCEKAIHDMVGKMGREPVQISHGICPAHYQREQQDLQVWKWQQAKEKQDKARKDNIIPFPTKETEDDDDRFACYDNI